MNILIAGAGALGSRHLQACLKLNTSCNIFVVDPSPNSISVAKERACQVENSKIHNLFFYNELKSIRENSFDYVIVATNAAHRYEISKQIIEEFSPKVIFLEKVLFQTIYEYEKFSSLIEGKSIEIYVNCPFRTYPIFRYIKNNYLIRDSRVDVSYSGGEWIGLCCNSIHYIDVTKYFCDYEVSCIQTDYLDNTVIQSKRMGYIELTGNLICQFSDGSKLSILSKKDSDESSELIITQENYKFIIDEYTGLLSVFNNDILVENKEFGVVYQSNLTNLLIEDFEKRGTCNLIKYEESADIHKKLIASLLGFYNSKSKTSTDILPIT
ncbi:MAG: Gfo/Idh/MocA family oxidoreductase [Gammaproteobacteria bacterium]|nr:Gfo/Idh/MocA family oxidoreductase [Gammaproteobacteria bacterium]